MDGGQIIISTDPESGDMLVGTEGPRTKGALNTGHFGNIATNYNQKHLDEISMRLTELVTYDEENRAGWQDLNANNFSLLGLGTESEPDTDTDDEASDTSDHPLLLTAMTRFQSKALSALLPSAHRMVRAAPVTDYSDIDDPEARQDKKVADIEAAGRVEAFYTDYLTNSLRHYEPDTDQILFDVGLTGIGLRKVTRTGKVRTPVNLMHVPLSDLIISYNAKTLSMSRYAHRIDMPTAELAKKVRNGEFLPPSSGSFAAITKDPLEEETDRMVGLDGSEAKEGETHRLYEIYATLTLDPDEDASPYIVTVHAGSQSVMKIERNWDAGDPDREPREHFAVYVFSPGKSASFPIGLGHILGNLTRALRKAQRQALQSAYLQNHPSGFKSSNLGIRDDATKVRFGEFVDVDSPTGDIRDAIMAHPFLGPSVGLMALAEKMEANGKELGGVASIDFSSLMKAGIAAGPAMAAFEESTEFQTAIHRRLYRAHRSELTMMHRLMREALGEHDVLYGEGRVLRKGDLNAVELAPVMRPGQASRQKALLEGQAKLELADRSPDIVDKRAAYTNFLNLLGENSADEVLVPDPEDEEVMAMDPVSEYARIIMGRPVTAGLAQDHAAHLAAHSAQVTMLQSSPLPVAAGDQAMAALTAHMGEHIAQQALTQVAATAGIPMESLGPDTPPEIEMQIAPLVAQAMMEMAQSLEPPNDADVKITVQQMKDQHAVQLQQMKAKQALELQQMKDAAAMKREVHDDMTALEIAKMKVDASSGNATARASAPAGASSDTRVRT